MSTLKEIEFISLFSGIGGLDLGLERAGMRCVAQVENNDYAQKVLTKRWPDVARFRDVRDVGKHNLPAADLICGGFPCQDISNAGKRVGIGGERSGLWAEFARIIGELRPCYALIENVSALLGRGFDVVLCDLAALGYDAEWHCIPAAAVGAPHIRDRVFILAYTNSAQRRACPEGRDWPNRDDTRREEAPGGLAACGADGGAPDVADADSDERHRERLHIRPGRQDETPSVPCGRSTHVADANGTRLAQRQSIIGDARAQLAAFERSCRTGPGQWAVEPDVGRVAHGVPARMDRLRGLGNAVVPQVAEFIGRAIVAHANAGENW
jgi:DNA (cytosine-5)-methyltransferase 1